MKGKRRYYEILIKHFLDKKCIRSKVVQLGSHAELERAIALIDCFSAGDTLNGFCTKCRELRKAGETVQAKIYAREAMSTVIEVTLLGL